MGPPAAENITPLHVYLSRRAFMRSAALAMGAGVVAACGSSGASTAPRGIAPPGAGADDASADGRGRSLTPGTVESETDELGEALTAFDDVTHYNNFYEFSTNKQAVAPLAADFVAAPWSVEVGGLCRQPRTFDLDDLAAFGTEERVYRLRCVEGWSMVIPWRGFPLARLLDAVEPLPEAAFVRFEALHDPARMPGQGNRWYNWPYAEGLRMDEARHDLTLLATGLYGTDLPPQNGAPVRLVVPWKYGFKSIKSIVRIELQAMQPATLWMTVAPKEYGFYANVNPEVDHPRWSQASERRIGEFRRRRTLMFNGYGEQVAHLYEGLDLRKNF